MGTGSRALARRVEAVVEVMRSPNLRRLQLGWASYFLIDGISMVGLSVWAFREGGTSAVGLVGLARLLPGAIALPFGAWAADRFSRRRVVCVVFVAVTSAQAATAVALAADAPAAVIYLLVAFNSVAGTPYRPAHLALAPLAARSPAELVAMNVTAGNARRTGHVPRPGAGRTAAARRRPVGRGRGRRRSQHWAGCSRSPASTSRSIRRRPCDGRATGHAMR